MYLKVGDQIQFAIIEETFDVRAVNNRFAICTSGTYHTIVDFENGTRGKDHWIFGRYNYSDPEDINICMSELMSGECRLSRDRVPLDIVSINGNAV